jgi:O-acetylhomoserine/O-acetylserine sulfhydrylase-like pyridoxal-dependent enzyme
MCDAYFVIHRRNATPQQDWRQNCWSTLKVLRIPLHAHFEALANSLFAVKAVYHPSLPHGEQFALAQAQMAGGQCGIFSIELQSAELAQALPLRLKLFRNATSLGGVESLIEWRHQYDTEVLHNLPLAPFFADVLCTGVSSTFTS